MQKRKTPMRQCGGCGEMKPKAELVRVVKSPDGEISLDLTGKKNGRGSYICKDIRCIEKAQKIRGLERGLKTYIPKEIYEECINIGKQ